MNKFLYVKTDGGYDLVLNTATINGIERNPNDREGSVWIWTTWYVNGQMTVNESFESIMSRLDCK